MGGEGGTKSSPFIDRRKTGSPKVTPLSASLSLTTPLAPSRAYARTYGYTHTHTHKRPADAGERPPRVGHRGGFAFTCENVTPLVLSLETER